MVVVLFTIIWWHSKISLNTALIYIPNYSPTFSFFLSFFLNLTSVYLIIIGVEGYFCTWLHSIIYIYTHTHGRTPLDEWSARRRDLCLPTHNTHKRQTSMTPGGIRTRSPSKRAAADPRVRLRGHWDRPATCFDPNKDHHQAFAEKLYIEGKKCVLYYTMLYTWSWRVLRA